MKNILFFYLVFFSVFNGFTQEPIKPSEVLFTNQRKTAKIIKHYAYTTCIDTVLNLTLWVSHAINRSIIEAGDNKKQTSSGYPKDPLYLSLKANAYGSSGYDHGHLAPKRDFKWNKRAWKECFYMTNMGPQYACLNQKGWCYLESLCREWALNSNDILYIVTGAIPGVYIDTLCINKKTKVFVPKQFYKVVLEYNPVNQTAKGIGFIVNNRNIENEDIVNSKCTIDKVEKITKLNFFSFLGKNLEDKTESNIGDFNFNYNSECKATDCNAIYANRTRPEKRSKLKCKDDK